MAKDTWQKSYASLVLGAIIVIILGLLVANYFTRRDKTGEIGSGKQTTGAQEEAKIPQEYKVTVGDSLSAISAKTYGSEEFWPQIAQVNNITNPNLIFVDSTLKLPEKSTTEAAKGLLTITSYQVGAGETLFTIAEKVYGDGSRWTVLDRANGKRRLPNGNPLVFAGSTIVVPR